MDYCMDSNAAMWFLDIPDNIQAIKEAFESGSKFHCVNRPFQYV